MNNFIPNIIQNLRRAIYPSKYLVTIKGLVSVKKRAIKNK